MPEIALPSPQSVEKGDDFIPYWAAKYFPDDDKSRRAFIELTCWEARQPGKQPSQIWETAYEKITKSHRQGHVAGNVALAMLQLNRWHYPASLRKASIIVGEYFAREENISRTGKSCVPWIDVTAGSSAAVRTRAHP